MTWKHAIEILASHMKPCAYCAKPMYVRPGKKKNALKEPRMPTRDHIIPKCIMPASPIAIVCMKCNQDKAAKTIYRWHQSLKDKQDERASIVGDFIKRNAHAIRIPGDTP